jgi:hypothetical protein
MNWARQRRLVGIAKIWRESQPRLGPHLFLACSPFKGPGIRRLRAGNVSTKSGFGSLSKSGPMQHTGIDLKIYGLEADIEREAAMIGWLAL